ncbi:O-acyltransferase (WSD1-like) family protein [Actinidia rufa]|uniref:O-acyltransferase (WSD1-like) family protein n=1 Tax=Actinidia rufa TaxID=165716 RepID=A0A7J0ESM2_9ERIC|nr:O-acyltransferase (WSD1-like) family protein [Actinidia rufa]
MDALPPYRALKPIKTGRDGGNDEERQPLSPMARLFHEPGSNVYIVGILGSKTKIYPDVAKASLVNGLLKHPRFSSLQVLDEDTGEIKWVATEVNLDDHVVVPEVESNMESPDKFVEDYISNLTKPKLDKSKPLWDLHLLNIKTSESEGVIVYRVHHSIGDGMSIMSLLLACSRKVSDPMALPTIPEMKKSSPMKAIGFWSALQLIWNTVVGVFLFVGTTLFLKDTETPIKGPPGVENKPSTYH